MKKIFGILGLSALLALFFLASPVSATHNEATVDNSISVISGDIPATIGKATIRISGTWRIGGMAPYVVPCPGANGDTSVISAGTAPNLCPTVSTAVFSGIGITVAADGSFAHAFEVDITQAIIDTGGLVFLVGEVLDLSGTYAELPFTINIASSGASAQTTTTTTQAPATTTTTQAATTTTQAPATTTTTQAPDHDHQDDIAKTGVESGLLAVVGVSVVLAGLFFAGIGRRLRRK